MRLNATCVFLLETYFLKRSFTCKKKHNCLKTKSFNTSCVGANKIGIEICRGNNVAPRIPFVILNCSQLWFHKNNFWPNYVLVEHISAWKKLLPKWQYFFYIICYGPKKPKCFKKRFGRCFMLTLHGSERFFFVDQKWQYLTILGKFSLFDKKKCYQNGNFCFTLFVIARNDQNVSKKNFW